jgi:hypothetical protein
LSDEPVDVSGWCVNYSSSSDVTKRKLSLHRSGQQTCVIFRTKRKCKFFSSGEFVIANPGFVPDFVLLQEWQMHLDMYGLPIRRARQ